jgi:hypothetical protein
MALIAGTSRAMGSGRVDPRKLRSARQKESFRDRVKRLKSARGWTFDELAAASGVPAATIKQSATCPGVTAATVSRLALALNVSMDYLFRGGES